MVSKNDTRMILRAKAVVSREAGSGVENFTTN